MSIRLSKKFETKFPFQFTYGKKDFCLKFVVIGSTLFGVVVEGC